MANSVFIMTQILIVLAKPELCSYRGESFLLTSYIIVKTPTQLQRNLIPTVVVGWT